jgi:hypothetical protein
MWLFHIVPKIRVLYSQKWNCTASFPIPTFMWAIFILPCYSQIGRQILGIYKSLRDTWMWNCAASKHYNFEAAQFHFWEYINRNQIFTVYWILTGPSFAVQASSYRVYLSPSMWLLYYAYRILGLGKKVVSRCPFHNSPAGKYSEHHIINVNSY